MNFLRDCNCTSVPYIQLYEKLLATRLYEERMLLLLKQNRIAKWFSSIGQEAISVGATLAMRHDDFILPAHRNLGVFISRELPLDQLTAQIQGKDNIFTAGRDRSFHFGSLQHYIIGMISHMAAHLPVACGVALAHKLDKAPKVVLTFCGEGATSEGDFHEAINIAAVWKLPIIFLVENNGWSISTPVKEQFACRSISEKGSGYGIEAYEVDGNNILAVYELIVNLRKKVAEDSQPVLVEALTYRVRGHEEASGTAYMPQQEIEKWKQRDPLLWYESFLLQNQILSQCEIQQKKDSLESWIHLQIEKGLERPEPLACLKKEVADVFAPVEPPKLESGSSWQEMRLVDSIRQALWQAMEKYDNLVLMGQDIAEYGGVFKVTEGFLDRFGKERVRNTPLCESAVVGMAVGLSALGKKSVIEIQYADFVSCAFNQIVNNVAKTYYRWKLKVDTVIRLPVGGSIGAGPFHSQTVEAWFTHVPGLQVYYPAFPEDAKGLLVTAIEQPNPVLFLEHKALYRKIRTLVPKEYFCIPPGKAKICKSGDRLTLIAYGLAVYWALEVAEQFEGIEVIDLRTLIPWDKECVRSSVAKTGKVLICHEDTLTGGFGAEIAAWIAEHCFSYLDAPIVRVASADTPIPFAKNLEDAFLASSRLYQKVKGLLAY
ncbi:MAG: dehydrogenase E1 component subunit alpha/beta [Cytophagales bacterium]|nr:dehydrogenase E1 component subunit alpha/beta [Cytophagales bacterium]MDW8384303.1 dehydrogenase E1 component subunit alpha/beta [Flammeovirgaceae bacterium]